MFCFLLADNSYIAFFYGKKIKKKNVEILIYFVESSS